MNEEGIYYEFQDIQGFPFMNREGNMLIPRFPSIPLYESGRKMFQNWPERSQEYHFEVSERPKPNKSIYFMSGKQFFQVSGAGHF